MTPEQRVAEAMMDRPWRILEAIRRRELGLSPETHICMGAIQTSASVSMRSPWREVPDAD